MYYVNKYENIIGKPNIILCLDSGTIDYNHLTLTDTLRGVCKLSMKVSVLKSGVHSGDGSGIIPDSFMIMRQILD